MPDFAVHQSAGAAWTMQLCEHRGDWYVSVRQRDRADCAPAALLACVLQRAVTSGAMEALRQLDTCNSDGNSLAELQAAAGALGRAAISVQAEPAALDHLHFPVLALLRLPNGRGHYVTIHDVDENRIVAANPSCNGLSLLDRRPFLTSWTGKLVLLS